MIKTRGYVMKRNVLVKAIAMVLATGLFLQGCEKKAIATSVSEPTTTTSSVETVLATTEPAPEPSPAPVPEKNYDLP